MDDEHFDAAYWATVDSYHPEPLPTPTPGYALGWWPFRTR